MLLCVVCFLLGVARGRKIYLTFLQLLLLLLLGLRLLTLVGLVDVLIGGLTAVFAQALDELCHGSQSSLAVEVNDLIGSLGEELDGWEALDLDVLELI